MTMGQTQTLRVARATDNGLYLTDSDAEVLLPKSEVPEGLAPGGEARVFLYRDSEDRPTATLRRPFAEVGQVGWLEVADVNDVGAFVDFGLRKHLLVPRSQQHVALKKGQKALVLVLLDEETDRLFGTTLLAGHLSADLAGFRLGQEVACRVWRLHDKGWTVLVNHRWQGLVYRNESPRLLAVGEALTGYVYVLRDDGKLDIRLRPQGFSAANPEARQRILAALDAGQGRLALGDQSTPEEIQTVLGLSKKAFKTACGTLWKEGLVVLAPTEVRLSATSGAT